MQDRTVGAHEGVPRRRYRRLTFIIEDGTTLCCMRKSAPWMCKLDERILEHLDDEPWSSPTVMASLVGFQFASERRLAERCRVLARVGFIGPLHGDAYEITGLGERYLDCEVNAAHYGPWARE